SGTLKTVVAGYVSNGGRLIIRICLTPILIKSFII
ncbi:unnamed protein product, partial [Rotaria sp. Silwood2]